MRPTENAPAPSLHVKAWLTIIEEPDQRHHTVVCISRILQAATRTPDEVMSGDQEALNWLLMLQCWLLEQDGEEHGFN